MIRFSPKKLRDFNKHLFAETTFDAFLVPEAHFVTSFRTDFEGKLPPAGTADTAADSDGKAVPADLSCVSWKELRPIALQLVRGQVPPKSFSIVMKLPEDQAESLFAGGSPAESAGQIPGFYLNIRYAKEELMLTSGCMQKTFSLDKTWEKAWDKHIEDFLSRLGLI